MADRNEPGGGVVPSAFAELRRASRDDLLGLANYLGAILAVGLLIVLTVALA
jgi:hypothetical protein